MNEWCSTWDSARAVSQPVNRFECTGAKECIFEPLDYGLERRVPTKGIHLSSAHDELREHLSHERPQQMVKEAVRIDLEDVAVPCSLEELLPGLARMRIGDPNRCGPSDRVNDV